MYDLNLIKSRISCVDVAQRHDLPIRQSGDRCVSPLREGATNASSFVVNDDFWYDFGSASGGDAIDLEAELSHNGDRGAAIRALAVLAGVAPDQDDHSDEWYDYTNHLNAMTAFYHSQLTEDDRRYLRSRGVSDSDADRLMIGRVTDGSLRGRLFLPYIHPNGYVCYYATRAMPNSTHPDAKYMKQHRDPHCQHIPWGMQTLNRSGDTLVIAEGYFDAASFEIAGFPVISAITGNFSRQQLPLVLSVCRRYQRVFIVYDNDPISHAGATFTQRMSEILTAHRIPFVVGTVPPPYKDISEYYAAGGNLQSIIDRSEDGVVYIASKFTDFSELEHYIYKVARRLKQSQLDDIFDKLRKVSDFERKKLDLLYKTATTAPPETIIADEIMHDHQLIYVNAVGFYEYNGSVWQRLNDIQVMGFADDAYGEFSTAQRISAILKLLKTRAIREVVFDRSNVWNFLNGTLELDTGTFREHSPHDYCSAISDYPYNPDATHHAWDSFIEDVTAGDPRAAELLQLIPGYALCYQDNRLERVFVLSGSGGNGKSKYLEILRRLFGEDHVSHLQPRALLDKFQVIQLRDSIINIAGEIRSDLRDVEEAIKSIASGEPLSGCYKGQDFITFVPRTKLIYATNAQLQSGDTSEGLTRRLILVDFKVSFVDHPDPSDSYQRKRNPDILDSIMGELQSGGIFNWAYEGGKLLRSVGYFTETTDQEKLIQDFRRSSNPVLVFWEDYRPTMPSEITNGEIYRDYQQWCCDNGEKTLSSIAFHREFKRVSGKEIVAFRTNSYRGYKICN